MYAIAAEGTDRVKLGYSAEPERRLEELQVASAFPLILLWRDHGHEADEKRLHERFREHRVQGEWFRRAGELDAWLRTVEVDIFAAAAATTGGPGSAVVLAREIEYLDAAGDEKGANVAAIALANLILAAGAE